MTLTLRTLPRGLQGANAKDTTMRDAIPKLQFIWRVDIPKVSTGLRLKALMQHAKFDAI
jgi:hypothetical protein